MALGICGENLVHNDHSANAANMLFIHCPSGSLSIPGQRRKRKVFQQPLQKGDVISVSLDMDNRILKFARNGAWSDTIFSHLEQGPWFPYFGLYYATHPVVINIE